MLTQRLITISTIQFRLTADIKNLMLSLIEILHSLLH